MLPPELALTLAGIGAALVVLTVLFALLVRSGADEPEAPEQDYYGDWLDA